MAYRILTTLLSFTVFIGDVAGQTVSRTSTIGFSQDTTFQLNVGGTLDASNTVGRRLNYEFGLYRYYALGFEPLNSVTLSNQGINTVNNVSLIFNGRGQWQSLQSIAQEVFGPGYSQKKNALMLWKFVHEHHAYFYSPEPFNTQEVQDPIKFLTGYGYGDCFMVANAVKYINTTHTGDSLWIWGLNGGTHAAAECRVGNSYALLDADEGGFYLKLDNKTLASYDDVRYDPYLYLRTQHFGPAYPYSSVENYFTVENYLSNTNYRSRFWEYGNSGINTSFNLKPGESFSYVWPDTSVLPPFHQLTTPTYGADPTLNDVGTVIKVGVDRFTPSFLTANTDNLLYLYDNIVIDNNFGDTVPVVHPSAGNASFMIIQMGAPFVLTGANVKGSFYVRTPSDHLTVDYSPDLVNWTTVWQSGQSGQTGHFTVSIPLDAVIGPVINPATYGYFLRATFSPVSSINGCGVDSLSITDSTQVSRFFAPRLLVGQNSIAVQTGDSNKLGRQLSLSLQWAENATNNPPAQISGPVFPLNGATVDSTSFTFSWQAAKDPDGDSIVDYYFQLSDDSAMAYPLATNYDRYMSATQSPVTNQFTPERPDFLNDGTTYYWRVRPLDSRGAWGPWSPVWSFTPHGPRTPLNFRYVLLDSAHIQLQWSPNPLGNPAVRYLIYQDTARGTFPLPNLVIGNPADTVFTLPFQGVTYFRVAAEDANNVQSPPSSYLTIWPPVKMNYGPIAISNLVPLTANNGYSLQYSSSDTTALLVRGDTIVAKRIGISYLYAGFLSEVDSVFAQEIIPVIVSRAPLIVKAADMYKLYGDTLLPLWVQYTGFVNGDDSASLQSQPELTTNVTINSPVGLYPIEVHGGADSNYNVFYENGNYTVDKATLTVTAINDSIQFGNNIPALHYQTSGWKAGDSTNTFEQLPSVITDATRDSAAGFYPITVSGGAARNYRIAYVNGILIIEATPPKLSLGVRGDYPDSSYEYTLKIDSTGGAVDIVRLVVTDLDDPSGDMDIDPDSASGNSFAPMASFSALEHRTYTGKLSNLISGHNYEVYAVARNSAGADTSNVFNIYTNVDAPFVVYPVPASSTLNVRVGIVSQDGNTIVIYDEQGHKSLEAENISGASYSFDVSGLAAGVYYVCLIRKKHTYVKKVVIIH